MYQSLQHWLKDIPLTHPIERQLAPLLQLILIALAITAAFAIVGNVFAFGLTALTPAGLAPNALFLLLMLGNLALVRRGYFKAALWIFIIAALLGELDNLLTTSLDTNGETLLIFTIPIAIAGLMIGRQALILVASVSILMVVGIALWKEPLDIIDSTLVVFISIIGLLSFLIDIFGNAFRRELRTSVDQLSLLTRARNDLEQSGAQLAQTKERLEVTLASIGDGVIATDIEGRITLMNPVAEEITGWAFADAQGKDLTEVFQIVNETTQLPVENPVTKVIREGVVVGLANHTILISKAGHHTPIDDSGAPIRDHQGNIIGAVLVFRDITEKRQAEDVREMQGVLLSGLDEGFLLLDEELRFVYLNDRAVEMALEARGRSKSELIGAKVEEAFPEIAGTFLNMEFQRVLREQTSAHFENYVPAYKHWYELRVYPTRSGLAVFVVDISLRKHTEERLRLLQMLTESLSEAVTPQQVAEVMVDGAYNLLGGHLVSIVQVSEDRQYMELLNYKGVSPEILERYRVLPLSMSSPLTDAIRTGSSIWLQNLEAYQTSYPHIAQDVQAVTKTQAIAAIPMKVNGEIIGGVGISFPQPHVFDEGECDFLESLTDQCAQALERARLYATEQQARIKAEEADHLKMRFLAMISHELRTPLTSIKGFSTTLLATDITWDESSQTEFIEIIDQESDKLTGLVDDLLDMSRLQIGTLRITPEVRPLEFIIQNARANLETLARDHVLSIQVPAGMPPVMADATRIAQVISNLVSNAVRYSPAGTKIDVSAHQVGEMIQIDVSDEGEGIPATDRTLVFEAFRQLDRKNEGHKKGAGLGLAICKGMVEAHGGHIWIQDRPGAGTTISFTIPVAR